MTFNPTNGKCPVRTVAMKLRRQIHQIYGMCRRLGISAKVRKESLSMYALARFQHKRPQIVRRWIESGALQAENEGTTTVPRHMDSQDSLRRFCKDHPELIAGDRISQERLKFIFEYVFPRPHNDLLPLRESKKECAAYAKQMSEEPEGEFNSKRGRSSQGKSGETIASAAITGQHAGSLCFEGELGWNSEEHFPSQAPQARSRLDGKPVATSPADNLVKPEVGGQAALV